MKKINKKTKRKLRNRKKLKKVNVNSRWGTRKNEGFVLLGALVAH